jgi:hypothetical protein
MILFYSVSPNELRSGVPLAVQPAGYYGAYVRDSERNHIDVLCRGE